MAKSKFRVLQATEKEATDIAQVLANKTAKKILEYVAEQPATESELVKKLKISASTVHYNIKQLKSCHLLVEDAMHYSEKGKEVIHYKATDEHIIISPKSMFGLAEKLQAFVPALLLLLVAYVALGLFTAPQVELFEQSQDVGMDMMEIESASAKAMPMAVMAEEPIQEESNNPFLLLHGILIGIIISFIAVLIVQLVKKR